MQTYSFVSVKNMAADHVSEKVLFSQRKSVETSKNPANTAKCNGKKGWGKQNSFSEKPEKQ